MQQTLMHYRLNITRILSLAEVRVCFPGIRHNGPEMVLLVCLT